MAEPMKNFHFTLKMLVSQTPMRIDTIKKGLQDELSMRVRDILDVHSYSNM